MRSHLSGSPGIEGRPVVERDLFARRNTFYSRDDPDLSIVAKDEAIGIPAAVIGVSRLVAARSTVDIPVGSQFEYAVGATGDPCFGHFVRNQLTPVLDDLCPPWDFLHGEQTPSVNTRLSYPYFHDPHAPSATILTSKTCGNRCFTPIREYTIEHRWIGNPVMPNKTGR